MIQEAKAVIEKTNWMKKKGYINEQQQNIIFHDLFLKIVRHTPSKVDCEALSIPAQYFEPLSKDVKTPKYSWPQFEALNVFYDVKEEDGFFENPELNKTFHLKDSNHLQADFKILSRNNSFFKVVGTLEGYTKEKEEMNLCISNRKEMTFILKGTSDNLEAMRQFPLWQSYWKLVEEKELIENKVIESWKK